MRKIILILFLFIPVLLNGTTYYIKNGGNNALSGTSDGNAWETISKVNSSAFLPGDQILFNKGDKFIGTLTISNDGSAGNHIVFGSYGSGDDPILTPNDTITGITWAAYGVEGIYSTTDITYNPGNLLINWGNKINKINDYWFANPHTSYNNWTSLDFMRLPSDTSWTVRAIPNIAFWDALEAFYCYDATTGTTYIRFRNGENPNDSILAFSATGYEYAAIRIVSKDYITIQNLHILGGCYGIYIVGPTSITSNNIVVDNCTITSSNEKIRISSSKAVIIKNCTITNNYLSSYSPGAWENGTAYEDGVQFNYYSFFKVIVDLNTSGRADGAINMSGGMSDNCSFYNNTIEGCADGIAMYGKNIECYSNTITGTSSMCIFTLPRGPVYIHDNYLSDCNIGIRFGSVDVSSYDTDTPVFYVYKNRIYIPDAGVIMYLHYANVGPSIIEAYFYHNSFIAYEGLQVSSYADSYTGGTGFLFVNNIVSCSWYNTSGYANMGTESDLFIYFYNYTTGLFVGAGTGEAVWATDASNLNYPSGPTYWDHSIDPPDYTDTRGKGSIDKGIDIAVPFTLGGTNYSALPGTFAYSGTPDIGYYEYEESISRKVKSGVKKVKYGTQTVYY